MASSAGLWLNVSMLQLPQRCASIKRDRLLASVRALMLAGPLLLSCGGDSDSYPGPSLSPEECAERGGKVIADPGDGSVHRSGCSDGYESLGSVLFGEEGAVCCKRLP